MYTSLEFHERHKNSTAINSAQMEEGAGKAKSKD